MTKLIRKMSDNMTHEKCVAASFGKRIGDVYACSHERAWFTYFCSQTGGDMTSVLCCKCYLPLRHDYKNGWRLLKTEWIDGQWYRDGVPVTSGEANFQAWVDENGEVV